MGHVSGVWSCQLPGCRGLVKPNMFDASIFNIAPASLTLGAVLARGANGTVLYEADLKLQGQRSIQVAVKKLCTAGASPAAETAFLKEVRIAQRASATCQRVCRMLGCCKLDNSPCIVMSLYASSAAHYLESLHGQMGLPDLLSMSLEILEGLAQLHAADVWHLDLKPANILLDEQRHAYLSDFGISYALQTLQSCTALTSMVGTPHYMAPEQTGEDFGSRGSYTDVWGFATTVLHLATGQLPYNGLTLHQILTAMIKSRPPAVPETLPVWLQRLLKECLSFDVAARPGVQQLLQAFQDQLQLQAASCSQAQSVPPGTSAGLVTQLRSSALEHKLQASRLISTFAAESQHNRDALIAAGAVPHLAVMLQSHQPGMQAAAAAALVDLAASSQRNREAVIAAGAVPPLVVMLRSSQHSVQQQAAAALANFAAESHTQRESNPIVAAGALPLLVGLLGSGQPAVQTEAAAALRSCAAGSQHSKDAVIAAGALPPRVTLLRSPNGSVQEQAAAALTNLASGSQANRDAIVATDALPVLVSLLLSDQPLVQTQALWAIRNIATGSQHSHNAIILAGALPGLVRLLQSDQPHVQTQAAMTTLSCVAASLHSSQWFKDAVTGAGLLPALVGLRGLSQPGLSGMADEVIGLIAPGL